MEMKLDKSVIRAEEAALSILKPSKKQLEHGLELHGSAVVCDAYGFAPRCAAGGEKISAEAREGASPIELKNMFEEHIMTRCVSDEAEREEYLEAWEKSGVTCIFQNAGEEEQSVSGALKRLSHFIHVTDMMPDSVSKAVTPDDIARAKRENRRCLYMTSNTVPIAEERISVEEELQFLRVFFNLGVRMMHLTYNRRNLIGDGCAEGSDAGLSDFGREVIRKMNEAGIIVDTAHSGQRTSLEAAKASKLPVVASHSVCRNLNDHFRGKYDAVIKAIAESGGYIGIVCVPRFLGLSGEIDALLDHIDYAVKTFGADHVAISSDRTYVSSRYKAELKKLPVPGAARTHWRSLWPEGELEAINESETRGMGCSLEWTNWPLFTVGLVTRGYSDEDIIKIIGGNVLRTADEVIRGREPL